MPAPPPNAYSPGTRLTVGSHKISIIKYISAGGFAHVYTCNIDPPFNGSTTACLKRVVVPNKWQLNLLRQEVDAMKRLRGNTHIVSYIDSHASRLNNPLENSGNVQQQQYEVFLLMEYCSRNGLIDFMNTRLTHKLTEPEILTIMHDVTIGVAMCHHLQPPLIHRDIKIENVLIDDKGTFKLCDFGSAVGYLPVSKNPHEARQLYDDLMQHTTPQYRSPEMIDLSKGFPIDDKLDIWALGCFLYKLCYYTTPFELTSHSSLQDMEALILNCDVTLKIPHNQPGLNFSPRLKNIIKCCLRPDPRRRPNAVQLLEEVCSMRGDSKIPNVIPHTVQNHHNSLSSKAVSDDDSPAPVLPTRPKQTTSNRSETLVNMKTSKPTDPFASIDKSKFLQSAVSTSNKPDKRSGNRINTSYIPSYATTALTARPLSTVAQTSSSSNLKSFIQRQLNESSEDISSNRKSDENDRGTLEFLRSKEEEINKLHLGLRQNTGGSIKLTFKHGLRKISTGGSSVSSSAQNTGNNNINTGPSKRSSIGSIKQLLTGNGNRRSTSPDSSDSSASQSDSLKISQDEKPVRKLSIQRRMALLMNNKDTPTYKSATGYGRFTEKDYVDQDDIAAINHQSSRSSSPDPPKNSLPKNKEQSTLKPPTPRPVSLSPPKVPKSLSAKKASPTISQSSAFSDKSHSIQESTSPQSLVSTQSKLSASKTRPIGKKPPPKPKKPVFLKSPGNSLGHERRLSDTSEISLPDLDDMEKQFSKRFPSYV